MSNNQWRQDANLPDWIKMGMDCSAEHREKGFADIYRRLLPDAVGLQEVSPAMLDRLTRELNRASIAHEIDHILRDDLDNPDYIEYPTDE